MGKGALLSLLPSPQEDSSDLKCQLHFAKEESALMCKKLTKLVKDSEAMKEELAKYRSLYGDVNASLTVEEVSSSVFIASRLATFGFATLGLPFLVNRSPTLPTPAKQRSGFT